MSADALIPAGAFRRTPHEHADQRASWERSDQAFFAAGACHILAWVCRAAHQDEPMGLTGLRFAGEQQIRHVYATWHDWAYDHAGWHPESRLFLINERFEGRPLERVTLAPDLAAFCAEHHHRLPGRYWRDPLPRARAYLAQHPPPWDAGPPLS